MTAETVSHVCSSISAVVVAVSSVIAACFAVGGIRAYRRQLLIKDHYELAKQLLHSICKVRDSFAYVRNPYMAESEYGTNTKNRQLHELFEYAYQNRWHKLIDALSELETSLTQAQILWEADRKKLMKPVRECVVDLRIAIENRIADKRGEEVYASKQERIDDRKILSEHEDCSKDDFCQKIEEALEPITGLASKHLKRDKI